MSASLVAELILRASFLIVGDQPYLSLPANFTKFDIFVNDQTYQVSLEELGDKEGSFAVEFLVKKIRRSEFLDHNLRIDGPFGLLELTELLFIEEHSGKLSRRPEMMKFTSELGETSIKIDLDAVGSFILEQHNV